MVFLKKLKWSDSTTGAQPNHQNGHTILTQGRTYQLQTGQAHDQRPVYTYVTPYYCHSQRSWRSDPKRHKKSHSYSEWTKAKEKLTAERINKLKDGIICTLVYVPEDPSIATLYVYNETIEGKKEADLCKQEYMTNDGLILKDEEGEERQHSYVSEDSRRVYFMKASKFIEFISNL